jgi:hypothetical protein
MADEHVAGEQPDGHNLAGLRLPLLLAGTGDEPGYCAARDARG